MSRFLSLRYIPMKDLPNWTNICGLCGRTYKQNQFAEMIRSIKDSNEPEND